jgi:uncharacterized protein involved in exopolysaccharide biosynthesis
MSTNQVNKLQANFENDEISIREILIKFKSSVRFLKSKWKILVFCGLLGSLIGITIAYFNKPKYKAVLTYAMEEEKGAGSGLSNALGIASSFGIDLGGSGGGAFSPTNLSELMKSRLIIERVILKPIQINNENTTLADYYLRFNNLTKKNIFLYNDSSKEINNNYNRDSVISFIYNDLIDKENLIIQQKDKKSTIIAIEVKSQNELFSKYFCEYLAQETSNFYIETKSKKAKLNVQIIQKQVDSLRSELNNAILGYANESDNVYNLNPAMAVKSTPSKKKQIDIQANTTIFSQASAQLELAKVNLRKETPLIQLIDKPILPLNKIQFTIKKSALFGFLSALFISISIILIADYLKQIKD